MQLVLVYYKLFLFSNMQFHLFKDQPLLEALLLRNDHRNRHCEVAPDLYTEENGEGSLL